MPNIKLKADTLDQDTARFAPDPIREPLFVNSIPKSGSHLLMNIIRMFVPLNQQYREQFIQWGNLNQHLHALQPEFPFSATAICSFPTPPQSNSPTSARFCFLEIL